MGILLEYCGNLSTLVGFKRLAEFLELMDFFKVRMYIQSRIGNYNNICSSECHECWKSWQRESGDVVRTPRTDCSAASKHRTHNINAGNLELQIKFKFGYGSKPQMEPHLERHFGYGSKPQVVSRAHTIWIHKKLIHQPEKFGNTNLPFLRKPISEA